MEIKGKKHKYLGDDKQVGRMRDYKAEGGLGGTRCETTYCNGGCRAKLTKVATGNLMHERRERQRGNGELELIK